MFWIFPWITPHGSPHAIYYDSFHRILGIRFHHASTAATAAGSTGHLSLAQHSAMSRAQSCSAPLNKRRYILLLHLCPSKDNQQSLDSPQPEGYHQPQPLPLYLLLEIYLLISRYLSLFFRARVVGGLQPFRPHTCIIPALFLPNNLKCSYVTRQGRGLLCSEMVWKRK